MWLLRWFVILFLFLQALWMLSAFGLPIALLLEGDVVGPQLEALSRSAPEIVGGTTALEVTLSILALIFFVITIIRLVRRTQGWFYWLLGFLMLLLLRAIAGVSSQLFSSAPADLLAAALDNLRAPEVWMSNAAILGLNLIIGLSIIAVDVADKRHWAAARADAV